MIANIALGISVASVLWGVFLWRLVNRLDGIIMRHLHPNYAQNWNTAAKALLQRIDSGQLHTIQRIRLHVQLFHAQQVEELERDNKQTAATLTEMGQL